jgi:hypothetical protein
MSVLVVGIQKGQCLRRSVAVQVVELLCTLVWRSAEDLKQVNGLE